jgi:23S rRNA (uracil1939-C5)-methyltransferase
VRARVTKAAKGLLYAEVAEVLTPSPDRRDAPPDWRCGGHVLAHIAYDRQLRLKGDVLQETLARIGGIRLAAPPPVVGSPERGYRMRARLRLGEGRLGYFREGSHELCDPSVTGQLLPATEQWLRAVSAPLARVPGVLSLELIENVAGDERAAHLETRGETSAEVLAMLQEAGPLAGLSAQSPGGPARDVIGVAAVSDVLHGLEDDPTTAFRLRRHVRAFFQSNRYLLTRLVRDVMAVVPPGPVLELYAGVGLFGVSLASKGFEAVTMVEGDPVGAADLTDNAAPFGGRVRVVRESVESHVGRARVDAGTTLLIDPPRTGVSKVARAGIVALRPARIVYVSCDVATLARDARAFLEAGYTLEHLHGLDMFPNTAHVESVAVFGR